MSSILTAPPADRPTASLPPDPTASALVLALGRDTRRGTEVDGAISLFVRRARVHDEPVERMLARLKGLLLAHVRPARLMDDPHETVALLMRRAISAYYLEPVDG